MSPLFHAILLPTIHQKTTLVWGSTMEDIVVETTQVVRKISKSKKETITSVDQALKHMKNIEKKMLK